MHCCFLLLGVIFSHPFPPLPTQDSNDASPQFILSIYTNTITENHPVGNTVGIIVVATDAETEHTISYFPDTSDPDSAFFSVGRTNGVITLAQAVDYDRPAMHRQLSFGVCLDACMDVHDFVRVV